MTPGWFLPCGPRFDDVSVTQVDALQNERLATDPLLSTDDQRSFRGITDAAFAPPRRDRPAMELLDDKSPRRNYSLSHACSQVATVADFHGGVSGAGQECSCRICPARVGLGRNPPPGCKRRIGDLRFAICDFSGCCCCTSAGDVSLSASPEEA